MESRSDDVSGRVGSHCSSSSAEETSCIDTESTELGSSLSQSVHCGLLMASGDSTDSESPDKELDEERPSSPSHSHSEPSAYLNSLAMVPQGADVQACNGKRNTRRGSMVRSVTVLGALITISMASDPDLQNTNVPPDLPCTALKTAKSANHALRSQSHKKLDKITHPKQLGGNISKVSKLHLTTRDGTRSRSRINDPSHTTLNMQETTSPIKFRPSFENIETDPVTFLDDRTKMNTALSAFATDSPARSEVKSTTKAAPHPLELAGIHQHCLTDPTEYLLTEDTISLQDYDSRTAARRTMNHLRRGVPSSLWQCTDHARQQANARSSLRNYILTQGLPVHPDSNKRLTKPPLVKASLQPVPFHLQPEESHLHWGEVIAQSPCERGNADTHSPLPGLNSLRLNKRYSIDRLRQARIRQNMYRPPTIGLVRMLQLEAIRQRLETRLGGSQQPKREPTEQRTRKLSTIPPAAQVSANIPKPPPLPAPLPPITAHRPPNKMAARAKPYQDTSNSVPSESQATYSSTPSTVSDARNIFQQVNGTEFCKKLLVAMSQFIVRKEIVTRGKGGEPVVTFTLNRPLAYRYD